MARLTSRRAAVLAAALAACLLPLPATATPSAEQQAAELLRPPRLTDPTDVVIRPGATTLRLDPRRDYRVRVQPGSVLTRGVVILGGNDVVLEQATLAYARPASAGAGWRTRGLYLKGQTGTMYVAGLTIHGPLNEGINLDQRARGAAVVLKDIRIGLVQGSRQGHHADLLQTWAGPSKLVVSGFRGASTYQGFFLRPQQQWSKGPRPELFWLEDVDLDLRSGYYALWADGWDAYPLHVRDTVVRRNPQRPQRDQWLWPKPSWGDTTWTRVVGR